MARDAESHAPESAQIPEQAAVRDLESGVNADEVTAPEVSSPSSGLASGPFEDGCGATCEETCRCLSQACAASGALCREAARACLDSCVRSTCSADDPRCWGFFPTEHDTRPLPDGPEPSPGGPGPDPSPIDAPY